MRFLETTILGAMLIEPDPIIDERGSFARLFCRKEMAAAGLETEFVQDSESRNLRAGTLRGMHYNAKPHEEVKIVRCTSGAIVDVLLDLRPDSATYLKWYSTELTAQTARALYIPKGVAHGFQTLCDDAVVYYRISEFYVPEAGRGVRWDDPVFEISWPPAQVRTISQRDRSYPDYDPTPKLITGLGRTDH